MKEIIHVVTYHHKYGIEIELFASEEEAMRYIKAQKDDPAYDEEKEFLEYYKRQIN